MSERELSAFHIASAAIRTGRLANGTTLILWPEPRDTVVSVQIWVRVGSSDEQRGRTGLAHMLEHLMFRGTAAIPDGEFDRRMESLGASINAATWLDFTSYTATAPPEALRGILELEADRFAALGLTEEVFQAERSVVANERRQVVEADPVSRLHEELFAEALADTPYSWPTIGWSEDIAAFERSDAIAFHQRYYAPDNLAVVVCGAADAEEMRSAVEATFGALPARGAPARPSFAATARAVDRRVALPVSAPRLSVAWVCPSSADPAHAAWALLNEVLGGGESSRLPARLEMQDRSVLDVSTALGAHANRSLFVIESTLRARVSPDRVLRALDDELRRIALEGPALRELQAARMRLRTQDATSLATTSSRADWAGESWVVSGDPLLGFRFADRVAELGVDDVRAVARDLLESPRVVLRATPEAP